MSKMNELMIQMGRVLDTLNNNAAIADAIKAALAAGQLATVATDEGKECKKSAWKEFNVAGVIASDVDGVDSDVFTLMVGYLADQAEVSQESTKVYASRCRTMFPLWQDDSLLEKAFAGVNAGRETPLAVSRYVPADLVGKLSKALKEESDSDMFRSELAALITSIKTLTKVSTIEGETQAQTRQRRLETMAFARQTVAQLAAELAVLTGDEAALDLEPAGAAPAIAQG